MSGDLWDSNTRGLTTSVVFLGLLLLSEVFAVVGCFNILVLFVVCFTSLFRLLDLSSGFKSRCHVTKCLLLTSSHTKSGNPATCGGPVIKGIRRVRNSWSRVSSWVKLVILVSHCRIGEAAVPGPGADWTLGTCNPGGMAGKQAILDLHPCDVWTVCETHLTSSAVKQVVKGLRNSNAAYSSFAHGYAVLPRSTASQVGNWAGVGVLSRFPTRLAPHDWPLDVYSTSRLCCASTFVHDFWLMGCVVYGTPYGATHARARDTTNLLLRHAIDRLLLTSGPRYLAGDFNHDHDKLPELQRIRNLGFVEVQDLHCSRTGILPKATCRHKTRRDFLFISPELIPMFQSCRIDDTVWVDHATIVAEFQGGKEALVRFPWPQPNAMPWTTIVNRPLGNILPFRADCDSSIEYQKFWAEVEHDAVMAAQSATVRLPPKALGRGSRVAPQVMSHQNGLVKTGRTGEFQPSYFDYSATYAKWVKQLRRFQSYVRIAQVKGPSVHHVEHLLALWSSIVRASGFPKSFSCWWPTREAQENGPKWVPQFPPDASLATLMMQDLMVEVQALEKALRKHARYEVRLRKGKDLASLFRQVRRDPPSQVDVLQRSVGGTIANLDPDTQAIEFSKEVQWVETHDFVHLGRNFQPIFVTPDKLWVENVQDFAIGDHVVQNVRQGSLQEVFRAFEEQWSERWGKHANVDSSHWQLILDFAKARLRPISVPPLKLTVPLVRAAIHDKKRRAAVGLDGVSRADLMALDANHLQSIVNMFNKAQMTGEWPQQLLCGRIQSLAKCSDPCQVNDYRPVTVFGILYRVWSSLQSRYWLNAVDSTLNSGLLGNRQGKRAAHLWRLVLSQVEAAHLDDVATHGISV